MHGTEFKGKVLRPVLRAVIDARDFNGVLFDLVDGDIESKDQFAPPVHAGCPTSRGFRDVGRRKRGRS